MENNPDIAAFLAHPNPLHYHYVAAYVARDLEMNLGRDHLFQIARKIGRPELFDYAANEDHMTFYTALGIEDFAVAGW